MSFTNKPNPAKYTVNNIDYTDRSPQNREHVQSNEAGRSHHQQSLVTNIDAGRRQQAHILLTLLVVRKVVEDGGRVVVVVNDV